MASTGPTDWHLGTPKQLSATKAPMSMQSVILCPREKESRKASTWVTGGWGNGQGGVWGSSARREQTGIFLGKFIHAAPHPCSPCRKRVPQKRRPGRGRRLSGAEAAASLRSGGRGGEFVVRVSISV